MALRVYDYNMSLTGTALNSTAGLPDDDLSEEIGSRRGTAEIVIWALLLTVIIVTAVLGNILVIACVSTTIRLREEKSNMFLVNLSVTDIGSACIVMTASLHGLVSDTWHLGAFWCDLVCGANYMFIIVSMLTLCFISLDRYVAVVYTFRYMDLVTRRRIRLLLAWAWVQGFCFGLAPVLAGWIRYDYWEVVCAIVWHEDSDQTLLYVCVAFAVCFLLPGVVLSVAYCKIIKVAKAQHNLRPQAIALRPPPIPAPLRESPLEQPANTAASPSPSKTIGTSSRPGGVNDTLNVEVNGKPTSNGNAAAGIGTPSREESRDRAGQEEHGMAPELGKRNEMEREKGHDFVRESDDGPTVFKQQMGTKGVILSCQSNRDHSERRGESSEVDTRHINQPQDAYNHQSTLQIFALGDLRYRSLSASDGALSKLSNRQGVRASCEETDLKGGNFNFSINNFLQPSSSSLSACLTESLHLSMPDVHKAFNLSCHNINSHQNDVSQHQNCSLEYRQSSVSNKHLNTAYNIKKQLHRSASWEKYREPENVKLAQGGIVNLQAWQADSLPILNSILSSSAGVDSLHNNRSTENGGSFSPPQIRPQPPASTQYPNCPSLDQKTASQSPQPREPTPTQNPPESRVQSRGEPRLLSAQRRERTNQTQRDYSASSKAVKSLLIVVLAFFICMTPFSVTKLYKVVFPVPDALPGYVNLVATIFQYCSSVINPLIYGIFRKDFQRAFLLLFKKLLVKIRLREPGSYNENYTNWSF